MSHVSRAGRYMKRVKDFFGVVHYIGSGWDITPLCDIHLYIHLYGNEKIGFTKTKENVTCAACLWG